MVQTILDLLEQEFGFPVETRENPVISTIGLTSDIFLRHDPRRVALIIVNLSSNDLFIRPNGPAASTLGIQVVSSGGSAIFNWREDFTLPSLEWNCIGSAVGTTFYVLELLIGGGGR